MSLRTLPACFLSLLLVIVSWVSAGPVDAADDLSELKPGTKVIADVDGESVGEVIEKVAPGVYRVRVKIRTGDVIEPALPVQRLRLAQADAIGSAAPTKPKAEAPSVAPGTATSGTATIAPGTTTPGTATSGTVTSGAVQGSVTVTPGTVTPGTVTPGRVTPGNVTQATTPPMTISQGTVTPGTVTPGTVTAGSVTPGRATPGKATSGTVTVTPGAVSAGVVREARITPTPAGKAELESMVGTWNIVAAQRNGRPDTRAPKTITIVPTSMTIEKQVFHQVEVDPTSNPRRIDLAKMSNESPLRGIYKRDGERLRICVMDADDSIRPTDFTTTENDGRVVYECELRK